MDPVAHTLVGATLAEAGLKKLSRYATATLIIAVNLPDIDAVAQLWGADTALYVRRGWSHGILAMLVLPLFLAGAIWAWHGWRGSRVSQAPPFNLGAILLLAYIGTWSHPLLDWLNTYGVRLLMPFSNHWFYGDTLFIVDPWFWLLTAAGVVLAQAGSPRAVIGWALLAILATALILSTSMAPPLVKTGWLLGVALVVWLAWRRPVSSQKAARLGLAGLTMYVGAAYGLARLAESTGGEGREPQAAQANPMPGNPFAHRVVEVHQDHYRITAADGKTLTVDRIPPDAIVTAAMQDPSVQGFVQWMRFPYWEVEETADGWTVSIWDLRYLDPGAPPTQGIGFVKVQVSKESARH